MLFSEDYPLVLSEIDKEYFIAETKTSVKLKNFLGVLRGLAVKDVCTISDIVENDGYNHASDKLAVHKTYDRLINGSVSLGVKSLKDRRLVEEAGTTVTSKTVKQYRLTLFGAFYAIHVFSNPQQSGIDKLFDGNDKLLAKKNRILYEIAENYPHLLPLIFGKWSLVKSIGRDVEILVDFSHGKFQKDGFSFNTRPFTLGLFSKNNKNVNYANQLASDEITLRFFYRLTSILGFALWEKIFSKDQEIANLYSKYLKALSVAYDEEGIVIEIYNGIAEGDRRKANAALKKYKEIHKSIELSYLRI